MLGNILLATWEFLRGKMTWVILIVLLLIIPLGYFAQYVQPDTNIETNVRKGSNAYNIIMELKNTFSDQSIVTLVRAKTINELMSDQNLDAMRYIEDKARNHPEFSDRILFALSPAFMLDFLARMGMYNPETMTPEDFIIQDDGSLNPMMSQMFMVAPPDKLDDPEWQKYTYIDENGQRKAYYHGVIAIGLWKSWDNEDTTDLIDDLKEYRDEAGFDENVVMIMSGLPVIMNWMANEFPKVLATLVGIGSVLMLMLLTFGFRVLGRKPRRWLVVLLVLLSMVYTLGICGMIDVPLTNTSIIVWPILLGMSVDSCIQTHNRYDEEIRKGRTADEAVKTAIRRLVRPLWYGMTLCLIGFASVFVVDNQQVTYFGITLIIGTAICMVVMLLFLLGILYKLDKPGDETRKPMPRPAGWVEKAMRWLVPRIAKFGIAIIIIGVIASGFGWWADNKLDIALGFEDSAAHDVPEYKDMKYMQLLSGGIAPWSVIVKVKEGHSALEPEVLTWIDQRSDLAMELGDPEKGHYLGAYNNLGTLFVDQFGGIPPSAEAAEDTLTSFLPREMWIPMVNEERTALSVNFTATTEVSDACVDTVGILEEVFTGPDNNQPEAISSVTVSGLSITSIIMRDATEQSREAIVTVGVGGILVVLLLMFKLNWRRVLAAAFPILMVLGWSSLAMYILGFDASTTTALLPAQMMAIGIELTILLLMRYGEERNKGEPPMLAMNTAMSRIGRAIVVSGGMIFIGFFVMLFAFDFPSIQDFGQITMIDMVLVMIAVLVVMPALVLHIDPGFRRGMIDEPVPPVEEIVSAEQRHAST